MHFYYVEGTGWPSVATMKYGHYETMQDFVKNMNASLELEIGNSTTIYLTYSTLTGKVTVHLKPKCKLGLSGKMSLILGFGGKEVIVDTKDGLTQESPYMTDLSTITSIYTYCDIIQPQIVGDTSAQLLRSIPIEGKYGDIITKTFTKIQYVPVQRKSFGDVKIILRNDTGDPVPFERGKLIATLHFRAYILHLKKMNNPYVRYYLDQQQGRGMPVFSGSPWQVWATDRVRPGEPVLQRGKNSDAHGEKQSESSWKHCPKKWRRFYGRRSRR